MSEAWETSVLLLNYARSLLLIVLANRLWVLGVQSIRRECAERKSVVWNACLSRRRSRVRVLSFPLITPLRNTPRQTRLSLLIRPANR
jgi:hypothetical protein